MLEAEDFFVGSSSGENTDIRHDDQVPETTKRKIIEMEDGSYQEVKTTEVIGPDGRVVTLTETCFVIRDPKIGLYQDINLSPIERPKDPEEKDPLVSSST